MHWNGAKKEKGEIGGKGRGGKGRVTYDSSDASGNDVD